MRLVLQLEKANLSSCQEDMLNQAYQIRELILNDISNLKQAPPTQVSRASSSPFKETPEIKALKQENAALEQEVQVLLTTLEALVTKKVMEFLPTAFRNKSECVIKVI